MPSIHIDAANAALEKRAALYDKRAEVLADATRSEADQRTVVKAIDTEMASLEAEARAHVEREEIRTLTERAVSLSTAGQKRDGKPEMEWRAMLPTPQEWRAVIAEGTPSAGGYLAPQGVASMYVDKLRARSVFLKAPQLNVIPFETSTFVLPELTSSSTPGVVAEATAITPGTMGFAGLTFSAIAYKGLYQASAEVIDDSNVEVATLVANTLIRDIAASVDRDSFVGAGGSTALAGLNAAANSTTTNFSTGHTAILWDDYLDAIVDVIATGAMPTVAWVSPDQYRALIKQRTNVGGAGTGEYLSGSVSDDPLDIAKGLPLLPSANIPARTLIVADASRIYLGVRKDVRLALSTDLAFDKDVVSYRATYRIAGIRVAEATSVQIKVASAT
jgi:HK97 family phage major capsid protein